MPNILKDYLSCSLLQPRKARYNLEILNIKNANSGRRRREFTSLNPESSYCCGGARLSYAGGIRRARSTRVSPAKDSWGIATAAFTTCALRSVTERIGPPPLINKAGNVCTSQGHIRRYWRSPDPWMSSRPLLLCVSRCDWVARLPDIHFYMFPLLRGLGTIFLSPWKTCNCQDGGVRSVDLQVRRCRV